MHLTRIRHEVFQRGPTRNLPRRTRGGDPRVPSPGCGTRGRTFWRRSRPLPGPRRSPAPARGSLRQRGHESADRADGALRQRGGGRREAGRQGRRGGQARRADFRRKPPRSRWGQRAPLRVQRRRERDRASVFRQIRSPTCVQRGRRVPRSGARRRPSPAIQPRAVVPCAPLLLARATGTLQDRRRSTPRSTSGSGSARLSPPWRAESRTSARTSASHTRGFSPPARRSTCGPPRCSGDAGGRTTS